MSAVKPIGWGKIAKAALCAGVLSMFGCSSLADPKDTYLKVHPDAGSLVTPTPGAWDCLTSPTRQMQVYMGPPTPVTYSLPVIDWVDNTPPANLAINVCPKIDASCSSPLGMTPIDSHRDSPVVAVPLAAGFNGFLTLTSGTDYVPETFYFGGQVVNDLIGVPIQMIRADRLVGLAGGLGAPLDLTKGLVVLRAVDCNGELASGVRFDISTDGLPFTMVQGSPVLWKSPDAPILTDQYGAAGYANVVTGTNILAQAFRTTDSTPMGRSAFVARAGWITIVEVRPGT